MNPNQERFLKECCGAIYHCVTVYNHKEIPEYLSAELYSFFKTEDNYSVSVDRENMIVTTRNSNLRIEYLHHPECDRRMINLTAPVQL